MLCRLPFVRQLSTLVQRLMFNDMKRMQDEDRGPAQTRLQPAPLKRAAANGTAANGTAANSSADASPMQTSGARRVTARQSAKLQLQKQKQVGLGALPSFKTQCSQSFVSMCECIVVPAQSLPFRHSQAMLSAGCLCVGRKQERKSSH